VVDSHDIHDEPQDDDDDDVPAYLGRTTSLLDDIAQQTKQALADSGIGINILFVVPRTADATLMFGTPTNPDDEEPTNASASSRRQCVAQGADCDGRPGGCSLRLPLAASRRQINGGRECAPSPQPVLEAAMVHRRAVLVAPAEGHSGRRCNFRP
jgi:hypothetical protein